MKDIFSPLASALVTAIGGTLVAWLFARIRPGRLARTLDQATKIIEFVGRYAAGYDGLAKISEARRKDVENLMLDVMQAVRGDYAAERAALPEFEKTTSSIRRALLLYLPHRAIIWPLAILFHTLLLFMIYVVVFRAVQGRGEIGDIVALFIAGVCAVLVRLTVSFFSEDKVRLDHQ